jgi:uncharacterized protein (TIGR03435 family)
MGKLSERDRALLVLRFYENKSGPEAAALLGIREDAAHKRVTRAIEKLRKFFAQRGVPLTGAAIAGAVSANSIQAVPVAFVKTISAIAVAKGAAATASTLTLVKGALKLMAWAKMKMAIVVGAGILLAAGTATVTVNEIQKHDNNQWDNGEISTRVLETAPHIVKIIPAKSSNIDGWASIGDGRERIYGLGNTAEELVQVVYASKSSRTIFLTALPQGRFDFIANLTSGSSEAMKQLIKEKFGVTGTLAMVETNVLLLIVKNPTADGLKPSISRTSYQGNGSGHLVCTNQPISLLADMLEGQFRIPIIDRTSLTNRFDFNFTWDEYGEKVGNQYPNYPNLEGLKQVLLDQLGLELVPTNMPIEMLVVENVK